MSSIQTHRFDNGLTLLVEPIAGMQTAAMCMRVPAGVASEPDDRLGSAAVLTEMLFRGAGGLDARAHSDALDRLGVRRDCDAQTHHLVFTANMLADHFDEALPLLTDVIRKPMMPESGLAASKDLAIQAIESLEDEPQQKLMIELKRRHLPGVLGRPSVGELEHIKSLTLDDLKAWQQGRFVPDGSIIAFAGKVDFDHVRDCVGERLADWAGRAELPDSSDASTRGRHHVAAKSAQQHIGIAYDTISEDHADADTQRLGVAVLSGGMSGRLFTEVREKRGLCYAVYASYAALRGRGGVYAYAGTTSERAAETLEVLSSELMRLSEGVERDEFDRAAVGLKSRLVMQGESTGARAAALAADQYLLGRPRTLEERTEALEAVTFERLNEYLAANRPGEFTTVNIGPDPL